MASLLVLVALVGDMGLVAFDRSVGGIATMVLALGGIAGILFSSKGRKARVSLPSTVRNEAEPHSRPPRVTE